MPSVHCPQTLTWTLLVSQKRKWVPPWWESAHSPVCSILCRCNTWAAKFPSSSHSDHTMMLGLPACWVHRDPCLDQSLIFKYTTDGFIRPDWPCVNHGIAMVLCIMPCCDGTVSLTQGLITSNRQDVWLSRDVGRRVNRQYSALLPLCLSGTPWWGRWVWGSACWGCSLPGAAHKGSLL